MDVPCEEVDVPDGAVVVLLGDDVGEGEPDGDGLGDEDGEGDGLGDGEPGLAATATVSCLDAEPLPEQLRVKVVVPVRLPVLWLPPVPTPPIMGLIEQLEAPPVDQESVLLLLYPIELGEALNEEMLVAAAAV